MGSYYVSRIVNFYAHFGRGRQLIDLLSRYSINPFKVNTNNLSVIHVLSKQGHAKVLKDILRLEFWYKGDNKNTPFSITSCLKIPTKYDLNSPLHLASIYGRSSTFKVLWDTGACNVY